MFTDLSDIFINKKNGEIYRTLLEELERPLIEAVLRRTEGNQLQAAKMLGINRNTLRAKIKKLNIDSKKWKI